MMTLILGGARSGKSRLAQRLAARAARVSVVATSRAGDDAEWQARIDRHRADRPATWRTIEEPLALADAVEQASGEADVVLVDCLTLWCSNLLWDHGASAPDGLEDLIRAHVQRIALSAASHHIILVSNEVGTGIVPDSPVTRAFRDAQGLMNQWFAAVADEVILVVAGLPLYLKNAGASS